MAKKKQNLKDGYQPEESLDTNNPPGNEMSDSHEMTNDERREKVRTEALNNGQVKRMSAKEFRDEGYLQEVNRMFLHPLGLALEVIADENEVIDFGGIWDYRNEEEGMRYDFKNHDEESIEDAKNKALNVKNRMLDKAKTRVNMFGGSVVEPIPGLMDGL